MKKTIPATIILLLVILFTSCGVSQNNSQKADEIRKKLSSQYENPSFEAIKAYSDIDSEVNDVLEAKKRIDQARISLLKVLEPVDDMADKTVFAMQIMKMQRLVEAISAATDYFKIHIITIMGQSDDGTSYGSAKKVISATEDSKFTSVANSVLDCLTIYSEKCDVYKHGLSTALEHVNNSDFQAAGETIYSDSIFDYYASTAEMLNSLYDFEVFRAEIIEMTGDNYK